MKAKIAPVLLSIVAQAKSYRGSPIDRNRFFQLMRIQILQRCFKACGSFASFYNMREDLRYLKYLGPTLETVLTALESFPQYRTFRSLLVDNNLANLNYEDPTSLCEQ